MVSTNIGISTLTIVHECGQEHEKIIVPDGLALNHAKPEILRLMRSKFWFGIIRQSILLINSHNMSTSEAIKLESIYSSTVSQWFHDANPAYANAECDLISLANSLVEMEYTMPVRLIFGTTIS